MRRPGVLRTLFRHTAALVDAIFDRLIAWPEQITKLGLRMSGYRTRVVQTRHGSLRAWETLGRGQTPLMLLHGFAAEGAHYAPLLHRLRPHVGHLIVPDLPGHGASSPLRQPLVRQELRAEIVEGFDQLIKVPTVLYGNSLGGLIALDYAIVRPEKVKGLILCSPAGAPATEAEVQALRRLFQLESYDDALHFVDRLFVKKTVLRRLVAWGVRRKFADPKLQELLRALKPEDLIDAAELSALKVPTLLIWGREDHILPRSALGFFRRHLPAEAVVEEPEGVSHTPYLEDPTAVAKRIVAFVQQLDTLRA
jgi:pimeloyl-ACP methyl ester carboxylesterase